MLNWYYKHRIGTAYCVWNNDGKKKTYQVNIFGGNALCIFTFWYKDEKTGKTMERLLNFYADKGHVNRIMKNEPDYVPIDNLVSGRLNLYYKESLFLAEHFAKMKGIKVSVYYKVPYPKKK